MKSSKILRAAKALIATEKTWTTMLVRLWGHKVYDHAIELAEREER